MNKLWLKIAGVVVLIAAVVIGVCIFQPSTQQKESKVDSHVQPDMPKRHLRGVQAGKATPASSQSNQGPSFYRDEPVAQKYLESKRLYDAARKPGEPFYRADIKEPKGLPLRQDSLRVKQPFVQAEPGPVADTGYDLSNEQTRKMYDEVIQHSIEQFKNNPQQVGIKDTRGLLPLRPDSLRAKRPEKESKGRPPADTDATAKLSPERIQEIREMTLQHILDEYKDNPEQAEQIREILLERLRLLQKQRNSADAAGRKAD